MSATNQLAIDPNGLINRYLETRFHRAPWCRIETHQQRAYSWIHVIRVSAHYTNERIVSKFILPAYGESWHDPESCPAKREFMALEIARSMRRSPLCRTHVPAPIDYDSATSQVLMRYVDGRSLDQHFSAARRFGKRSALEELEEAFYQLGSWLHSFQTSHTAKLAAAGYVTWILHKSRRRLAQIESLSEHHRQLDFARRVEILLEHTLAMMPDELLVVPCHGDFGPWNVLVDDDRLNVIDFCCYHWGSRWLDPLNILTYIDTLALSPLLSQTALMSTRHAFLAGYGNSLPAASPEANFCWRHLGIIRLVDLLAVSQSVTQRIRRRRAVRYWTDCLLSESIWEV